MSAELFSTARVDKLFSEAGNRTVGEAWREREGVKKLYTGIVAAAKLIPPQTREDILDRTCRPGFRRLASGSQQIVVFPLSSPSEVFKIDRASLEGESLQVRAQYLKDMTKATEDTVGLEFIPPYRIEAVQSPLQYGEAIVMATIQDRIADIQDVFTMSIVELGNLPDQVKSRLSLLGRRIRDAFNDKMTELLPELIGNSNLVIGALSGKESEDVWLIDALSADRRKLETTHGPNKKIPDIVVYDRRLELLENAL